VGGGSGAIVGASRAGTASSTSGTSAGLRTGGLNGNGDNPCDNCEGRREVVSIRAREKGKRD